MTTATATTQIYQVFIKASPEAIWDAITKPEFTARYFFDASATADPERYVQRGPDGSLWMDEAVLEFDPPRRLVHEWRMLFDPETSVEPVSRVTYEIEPHDAGHCKLTLIHDRLENSPKTAANVEGDGWMWVLSGLKTLLETGKPLNE